MLFYSYITWNKFVLEELPNLFRRGGYEEESAVITDLLFMNIIELFLGELRII